MARGGKVIPKGAVLGATIVPEGYRIIMPSKPASELWRGDVVIQHGKDCFALVLIEPFDMGGENRIDEECLSTRDRMCAHDRMKRLRIGINTVSKLAQMPVTRLVPLLRGMPRLKTAQERLHFVG